LHLVLLVWATFFEKAQGSVVSNPIGMKFDRIVPQVTAHRLTELVGFDMTSYVHDGGHGVIHIRPPAAC